MAISASQVKALRETTGLGMMECKKALVETNGDKEAAIELLRKKAGAKVQKKAARTAADGAISIKVSDDKKVVAMVEVNSETDFVAKGDEFLAFAANVAACVATNNPSDVAELQDQTLVAGGNTVAKELESMITTLGEKMNVRRFVRHESQGHIGSYLHGRKIGVVVDLEGGSEQLARDVAMHIAAIRPEYISKDDVPAEVIAKEKEIFAAQAQDSGKPDNIVEKMVMGRVNKYLNEITLLGQSFVKDPDMTIEKLLNNASAKVAAFYCYEVGEGIERKQEDFAAEVMAQVQGE
ncbi:MAG: translation elongation factor Ts [Gammaproteobacteria bacterium]|nr:MAG: translation elongation factor Ts [Gammaproteobacteria bacterium]